jgi:hypothetical protein
MSAKGLVFRGSVRAGRSDVVRGCLLSQHGESLVETLVAILVASLSIALLTSVLAISLHILSDSESNLQDYYGQSVPVASQGEGGVAGRLYIYDEEEPVESGQDGGGVPVEFYMNTHYTDLPVVSYQRKG